MSARKVTVTLTASQAQALWYAAMYVTEVLEPGVGDGLEAADLRVTERAKAVLAAAIAAAEGKGERR